MTNEELNKQIHKIMGRPYHNYNECHDPLCSISNIDFVYTWQGFGIAWEFMQKHKRWAEFGQFYGSITGILAQEGEAIYIYNFPDKLISPLSFAEAMVEFFEENKPRMKL